MQYRRRTVMLLVLAVVAWMAPTVGGQTPDSWEPARTSDGRPDLQGVWLNNVATPLERLPELADRSHLTDEEVATLTARADRIFQNGRSAFTTPEGAFRAALLNVETYIAWSTSSSIGMVDVSFTDRTSLVIDPPDGRIPALTPAAEAREAAVDDGWEFKTGPEDLNSIHRCITTGVPRLGGNFGAGPYTYYQIVQSPTHLAFISEAFHDARIIPIGDQPHLPVAIRQWNGDSRGRWDGDTLVVETTNFSPNSYYRGGDRRPAPGGALHSHRAGHAGLSRHPDRPADVGVVVDGRGSAAAPRPADLRVRLPRGQQVDRGDAADGPPGGREPLIIRGGEPPRATPGRVVRRRLLASRSGPVAARTGRIRRRHAALRVEARYPHANRAPPLGVGRRKGPPARLRPIRAVDSLPSGMRDRMRSRR